MYFCDLAIGATFKAEIPRGHSREEFNASTTGVGEVFLSLMPRKYVLDGTRKTNLNLGPRNSENERLYWHAIGVNMYYVEDFDFQAYFYSSLNEQNEILLSTLQTSLLDIAAQCGADPLPIQQAIQATRDCGCERKYEIPKLARSTRSRRLKLNVFRQIHRASESWGIDIVSRKGEVLDTKWIAKDLNSTQGAYNFRKSVVQDDDFVILGTLGDESYRLNLQQLERELLGSLDEHP
jgi:hypothetical protein